MVVVVLTAGGALLALHAYNTTKAADPGRLKDVVFGIKQQAGVLAAICGAIFAVITALESAKLLGAPTGATTSSGSTPTFGRPWSERASSVVPSQVIDAVTT